MNEVRIALLTFSIPVPIQPRMAEKLRGFFGGLYPEENIFHNHSPSGKVIYRYPKIQFKIVEQRLAVMGLNEGADLVQNEFIRHEKIVLDGTEYPVMESALEVRNEEFSVIDELNEYRFESPWLAMNGKNNLAFLRGKLDLNHALVNNLLSDLKGMGIRADRTIMVKGSFTHREVTLDNTKMTGFYGGFVCNMKIPDYIGTGKRKSIGFGVIVRK
ncbi:MAG: hypothetical protein A2Y33_09665 [Spirochaetes bacterium GWF1_51_8]|nr:MAG: hypothetical protein A2Y33_09665 [Spirochaetes bacterium GWF1_51_8]